MIGFLKKWSLRSEWFIWLVAAAALRLLGVNRKLWFDEFCSISFAGDSDFWGRALRYNQPPLYYGLLKGWSLLGSSDSMLRIFSLLFGLLIIYFVFHWLSSFGLWAARLGTLLAVSLPSLIHYSLEIRPYPLLLACCAAIWFYAHQVTIGKSETSAKFDLKMGPKVSPKFSPKIFLATALTFAIMLHPIGVFMLPAVLAFFLCQPHSKNRLPAGFEYFLGIPALVFCGIFFVILKPHSATNWWVPDSLTLRWVLKAIRGLLGINQLKPSGVWLWPFGLIALISLLDILRRLFQKKISVVISLFAAFSGYLLPLVGYSLIFKPIILGRTLLPLLLPMIAILAIQIAEIKNLKWRWLTSSLLVIFAGILAGSWVDFRGRAYRENWDNAFYNLSQEWHSGDLLVYYGSELGYQSIDSRYFPLRTFEKIIFSDTDYDFADMKKRIELALYGMSTGKINTSGKIQDPSCNVFVMFMISKKAARVEWQTERRIFERMLGPSQVLSKNPWLLRFSCPNELR